MKVPFRPTFISLLLGVLTVITLAVLIVSTFNRGNLNQRIVNTYEQLSGDLTQIVSVDRDRANLQAIADSVYMTQSGRKFFVDSVNGMIWVSPIEEYIGKSNWDPKTYGALGRKAFMKLITYAQSNPDTVLQDSYYIPDTVSGLRIGATYFDSDRQLLFGFVVTQEEVYKNSFLLTRKFALITLAVLTPILLFLFFTARNSYRRYKDEARRSAEQAKSLQEEVSELSTAINRTTTGKRPSNYRSKPFDLAHRPGNNSSSRFTL